MKAYLVITEGDIKGQVHVLPDGGTRVLGRASDADWTLADSQVSRHHCVVWLRMNKVYLRDLVSRNGTFLDGEKIEPLDAIDNEHPDFNKDRLWLPGETLIVGDLSIELVLEDQPDAIRPAMRIVVPGQIEEESPLPEVRGEAAQNSKLHDKTSTETLGDENVVAIQEIKVAKLAVDQMAHHTNRMESLVLSQASRAPLAEQIRVPKISEKPERIAKMDLSAINNPSLSQTQPVAFEKEKKKLIIKKKGK